MTRAPSLSLSLLAAFGPGLGDDPLPPADPSVTRAELEHHVRFLASDELAGRGPMTDGAERSSQYIARVLGAAGVQPAGEGGTYFQSTGLKRVEYPQAPRLLFTDEAGATVEAQHGVDFNLKVRGGAHSTARLPLRFFYDYNHVRMPLEGDPSEALYFSADKVVKRRILEEKGIPSLDDWGLEIVTEGGDKAGRPRGLPTRTYTGSPVEACELVELHGPLLPDFQRRRFTHVQLLVDEKPWPHEDKNVVGRIPGVGTPENPGLAKEVVVLSAHYTYLGVRPPPRGRERDDSIFNGADDNASGSAVLLELAQALGSGKKPARTLVFLFSTGAENGRTGVEHYLRAPAEPLERTVANLDFAMLGRPDELVDGPGKIWVTGAKLTNQGFFWRELGIIGIVADPRPNAGMFERFDSSLFVRKGIVAQALSSYDQHRDQHSPRDEADTLDYAHLEGAARLALAAAQTLADGAYEPKWLDGHPPAPPRARNLELPTSGDKLKSNQQLRRDQRRNLEGGKGDSGTDEEADGDESGGDDGEDPAGDDS